MLIAFCQIIACCLFFHISANTVLSDLTQISFQNIALFGLVNMKDRLFIGKYDLRASDDLFIKGSSFIDIPDRFLRLILKYRIKYIVNILKIIIEGISVDLTYFTDILYRDLIKLFCT